MKPSTAPIGLGIAGCGNVLGAYLDVVRRLEHCGQARLVALCGREKQRAGKHVLVEKPMATSLPEAQALAALSLSSGTPAVTNP